MFRSGIAGATCFLVAGVLAGCRSAPKDVLTPPRVLTAPYDSSAGEVALGRCAAA